MTIKSPFMEARRDSSNSFEKIAFGALVWMGILLLSSCSMAPHLALPDVDTRLPDAYSTTTDEADSTTIDRQRWWSAFGDPTLTSLVDSALRRNLDIRIALSRVVEVQQAHRITRAGQFPGVQLSVDGNRQNTPTNSGATGRFSESIPQFPDRFDFTTYSASLSLAYELDFWGKARSNSLAAMGEFVATSADFRTVQMGVISETIATYFEIRDLQTQVKLARESADLLGERTELTDDRYRRGLVSSFELYAIRQALDDIRANVPLLESGLFEARGRLAVLLGTVIPELEGRLANTDGPRLFPDPIPAGIPSDILRDRPDVMAASARLEAARQRIGVARAEQFPSFSLTASGGTQTSDLTTLVSTNQRFWLFGGSLLAPIFRAGALKANVRASWARYEQMAAVYEKTVLTAFKDVSTALVRHGSEWRRVDAVRSALESASASSDQQLNRYRRGVGDYLALLDSRINTLRARTSLSSAERSAGLSRLGVHRALGGVWVEEYPDPVATGISRAE